LTTREKKNKRKKEKKRVKRKRENGALGWRRLRQTPGVGGKKKLKRQGKEASPATNQTPLK